MTAAPPAGWGGLIVTAGRPGLVPDVVSANAGAAHLQLFSGSAAFAAAVQQTVAVSGSTTYTLQAAISSEAVSGAAQ